MDVDGLNGNCKLYSDSGGRIVVFYSYCKGTESSIYRCVDVDTFTLSRGLRPIAAIHAKIRPLAHGSANTIQWGNGDIPTGKFPAK